MLDAGVKLGLEGRIHKFGGMSAAPCLLGLSASLIFR